MEKSNENLKTCRKCSEKIKADAKKCKHCGADVRSWPARHKILTVILALCLWPVALPALLIWVVYNSKMDKMYKNMLYVVIVIFAFSIIIGLSASQPPVDNTNSSDNKQSEKTTETELSEEEKKAKEEEEFKDKIKNELEVIKDFDPEIYKSTSEGLSTEAVLFSAWAGMINRASESEDTEIKKKGEELKNKVISIQTKEFPLMRKAYAEILGDKLWEHNVDVYIKGTANSTIEFIGYYFADRGMIKTTHSNLLSMLEMLRFDRANYKWIDYGEYTYYDLDSPKDNEIIIVLPE